MLLETSNETPNKLKRYRILAKLGVITRGGSVTKDKAENENEATLMTGTYLAYDTLEKCNVVVKRRMKKKEKKVHSTHTVDHPHCLKVYEKFIENPYSYIVLSYAEGGELRSCLRDMREGNQKAFDAETICRFFVQLCKAVAYCKHQLNLPHAGIHTSNIFLDRTHDNVYIGELGGDLDPKNPSESAYYNPPEVVHGGESRYGFSSDCWALGCTLYEMMTLSNAYQERFDAEGMQISLIEMLRKGQFGNLPAEDPIIIRSTVNLLLKEDPMQRMKIEQVLEKFQDYGGLDEESGGLRRPIKELSSTGISQKPSSKTSLLSKLLLSDPKKEKPKSRFEFSQAEIHMNKTRSQSQETSQRYTTSNSLQKSKMPAVISCNQKMPPRSRARISGQPNVCGQVIPRPASPLMLNLPFPSNASYGGGAPFHSNSLTGYESGASTGCNVMRSSQNSENMPTHLERNETLHFTAPTEHIHSWMKDQMQGSGSNHKPCSTREIALYKNEGEGERKLPFRSMEQKLDKGQCTPHSGDLGKICAKMLLCTGDEKSEDQMSLEEKKIGTKRESHYISSSHSRTSTPRATSILRDSLKSSQSSKMSMTRTVRIISPKMKIHDSHTIENFY